MRVNVDVCAHVLEHVSEGKYTKYVPVHVCIAIESVHLHVQCVSMCERLRERFCMNLCKHVCTCMCMYIEVRTVYCVHSSVDVCACFRMCKHAHMLVLLCT